MAASPQRDSRAQGRVSGRLTPAMVADSDPRNAIGEVVGFRRTIDRRLGTYGKTSHPGARNRLLWNTTEKIWSREGASGRGLVGTERKRC